MRFLRLLAHDLTGIWVAAFLAALLPPSLGTRLLWLVARLVNFHPDDPQSVGTYKSCWPDRSMSARELRWAVLMEAAVAWRVWMGRAPVMEMEGQWPDTPGFVAVGAHFGAGIVVLWSLREAGLDPRLIFRPPTRAWLWRRPAGYVWNLLRYRLILRLCPGGCVATGGSRSQIESMLESGDCVPVIHFDTPTQTGSAEWTLQVGARHMRLPTGGRDLVQQAKADVIVFQPIMDLTCGKVRVRLLSCRANELAERYSNWTSELIANHPEQWYLWPVIAPYFDREHQL